MRVTLTAQQFDLAGAVALDCLPDQTSGDVARRVSRVATLDGGAAFNDFGYSEADRTIELRWQPVGAVQEAAVARLLRLHRWIYVGMPAGLWLAAPDRFVPGAKESRLTLLVKEKVSQD